jgi:hypothetical protein
MLTQRFFDILPAVYQKFFPAFFEEAIPVETLATCFDCAMCSKPGEPQMPGVSYFKPDSKCCTFMPKLPNYLVGALLSDTSPEMEEGRSRIRKRIDEKVGILPYGIYPSKKFAVLYKRAADKTFGKNQILMCPYFVHESGNCSVWKYRETVCTTYYCKSIAGQEGKKFWASVNAYLTHAQDTLNLYAITILQLDVNSIIEHMKNQNVEVLEVSDLEESPLPEEEYSKLWGEWAGREMEFYKRSFEIIESLTPQKFEEICGLYQRVFLMALEQKRIEIIDPKIPDVLVRNPDLKSMPLGQDRHIVKSEIGFFVIQNSLFEVLDLFDGKRTRAEISEIIRERWNDTLRDDLLIPMFLNKIIIPF